MIKKSQRRDLAARLRRHKALARALHSRLFVAADGRLYSAAPGQPMFAALIGTLLRLSDAPTMSSLPFPHEFGCAANGEITNGALTEIRHALGYWSRAAEEHARSPRKRQAHLTAEQAEIARLERRLDVCQQPRGPLALVNYLLDAEEEQTLAALLAEHVTFTAWHRWLARIAFWLGGERATRRFVDVLAPFLAGLEPPRGAEQLRGLMGDLRRLRQRAEREPHGWLHVEFAVRMKKVPPEVLDTTDRRGKLCAIMDRYLEACAKQLAPDQSLPLAKLPALMAALAIGDGSAAPLPREMFQWTATESDFAPAKARVERLVALSDGAGYERLLTFLSNHYTPNADHFHAIRQLLAGGAEHADVAWALHMNLVPVFARTVVSAAWARQVHERLCARKLDVLSDLWPSFDDFSQDDVVVMDQWVSWVERLDAAVITTRIARLLRGTLLEIILPVMTELKMRDQLREWLKLSIVHHAETPLSGWLERIRRHQAALGREAVLPPSVSKHLEPQRMHAAEREHLAKLQAQGIASASQQARLAKLEALAAHAANNRRALRAAQEAYVVLAIEVLRDRVRRYAEEVWGANAHVGGEASLNRLLSFAKWIRAMKKSERELHAAIIDAWRQHGDDYKRRLPGNAA